MGRLFYYVISRLLASRYIAGAVLLFSVAGTYLAVRGGLGRLSEAKWTMDVAREEEAYLGAWANISPSALIVFRLQRDGRFTFQIRESSTGDTGMITGQYTWEPLKTSDQINFYPRIIARDAKGDTIFNYYVQFITPSESAADKIDHMELKTKGRSDSTGYTFFRLAQ